MKKILAMMLTAAMMLSMGTAALAADGETPTYDDEATVTITKLYKENKDSAISPTETFYFTVDEGWGTTFVTDSTVENTEAAVEASYGEDGNGKKTAISIGDVTFNEGVATLDGQEGKVTITLPKYTVVGIYYYTIKETPADTAGVTYYAKDIMLKVTVIEQNGKVRVAAVHTEEGYNGTEVDGKKKDTFENLYSAGTLEINKMVEGNLGDKTKDFTVTVVFTKDADVTVGAPIKYSTTGGQTDPDYEQSKNWETEEKEVAAEDGTTKKITVQKETSTVVINLKHNETVTFTNIPHGVSYKVVEDNYRTSTDSSNDYDNVKYDGTDIKSTITVTGAEAEDNGVSGSIVKDSDEDTVTITNTKISDVDTGISVDSIPYIAMLGVVAIGGTGFIVSKKRRSED